MAAQALILLLLTLTLSLLTTAHCGVFVVAPNVLNANEQETVSVLVTGRNANTNVVVTIQSHGRVHSTVTKSVTPDRQTIAKVRVDGSKLGAPDTNGQYYVQLRVRCTSCGNFDRMTDILVNKRTGTVFLQTDKPIYSPGQSVAIRVFALDENRRGVNMPVKMEIKNPQDIVISRKTGETDVGLLTDEFKISSRPLHGLWKIAVHFGANYSESREKQIEIKKYVLPHFQVRVTKLPEYVSSTTETIEGHFMARYSFAANVVGKARVVFRIVSGRDATYLTDKTYTLHNGRAKFTLDAKDMSTVNFNNLLNSKSHLQIEIIVTESSTGIKESIIAPKCHFVNSPYIISFDGTPANFMPGLPFAVKITATYIRGTPVAHTNLIISATDQQNNRVGVSANRGSGSRTNSDGVVHYYFDMRQDIETIKIKVNVEGDQKQAEHVTQRSVMPSYMKISPHGTRTLQPGRKSQFEAVLTDSQYFKRLHFLLVSGGKISDVGHEERLGMTILTFGRHISYNHAPSVRMVSWYFRTNDHKLVSASTKVQVERKCKTEAEVRRAEGDPRILKPGDTCDMLYKGTIGAKVATMVVDKSVYFMNNESRLDRKTFFDEFDTRDLGCAVGGGANATDVFTVAGLTVISDSLVTPPRRNSVNCTQTPAGRHKRSTDAQDPDDETCCNAGERFANMSQIILSSQRQRMECFRAASNYTSRGCKNSFGKCCIQRATERANEGQDHSRTNNEQEDSGDEMPMIVDEEDTTPRTDFPESWLLSTKMKIENLGETRKTVTMPGSITTWVFQAVTMSTTEGMCVAKPFEQIVRKELFIKLHLPHSAVLGEQMELAATVYNLASSTRQVRVSFLIEDGLCSNVAAGKYSHQYQRVRVRQPWTARWPIVPTKTGENKITFKLYSSSAPDIVVRTLNVVPSGDLVVMPMLQITQDPSGRHSSHSLWNGTVGSLKYTVSRDTSKQWQTTNVPLKLPHDALSDTGIMKVSLLGDVMTPIVNGFLHGTEKHLHKPAGCGEQTMARVGPLVFTARYLRQQGKAPEADTRKRVRDSVRHMLQYRKPNGGFAVWASRSPRIWLTAFTLKTFSQAREFTDIDNKVIDEAKKWLMSQNGADGMFPNTGIPHHRDMAGGAPGQLTLTAYIYISLLEAGHYQKYHQEMTRAMNSLAARTATENNAYTLAIVTYALAKFGHSQAETINQRLLTKARNLTGQQPVQTYWPTNPRRLSQIGSEMEVETAAYGLLAQLALGHVVQSNAIVEWLLRQRYAGDLFRTTQSTVLSLQALAEYSAVAQKDVLDMTCTLAFPESHHAQIHPFRMNNTNRLVQQTYEVTEHIGEPFNIKCKGTGVAHTTVETTYYSAKTQQENCAFNVTAKATKNNDAGNEGMTIEVCTKLKDPTQKLFMPMVEVGIGTGFKPVIHTLDSLLKLKEKKVDFYEVNDRSVVLYMDGIPSNKNLCPTFDVTRDVWVNYTQPVPVKVYAYYEPDKTSCRTFYDPLGKTSGLLDVKCDSEEASCKCLENQCAVCYGYTSDPFSTDATPPLSTRDELETCACSPKTDYVHVGLVLYSERRDGEMKHIIRIENVTKPGTEPKEDVVGQERVYVVPAKCPTCSLRRHARVLIMGHDGPNKKVDGIREYQLTPSSYVVSLYKKVDARALSSTERRVNKIHKRFVKDFTSCRL